VRPQEAADRILLMPRARRDQAPASPTTALSSAIKTARDIMRKDAGLSGETDRIPQFAWLLFLKAFDDSERNREVVEREYRPPIEAPYRWRDWAADPVNGRTGEELMRFVNDELLPYLRGLTGTGEFDARDAAGDSGEFYTPRPVIRFIVQQVAPRPEEIVLDPACGTGGFLVEALEHMRPDVKTVEAMRATERDLRGIEKKPLPYLLGMMNLLLHGVDRPAIVRDNALSRPVTQIRQADRVDVIITNPPFGGEEEKSIQSNFPESARTAETALLFVQLVERSLKDRGRCGMVVPNGFLFGDGVAARVKERLLTVCNLHTIVRLPPGVFAPYTDIPTNLIFFEKTGRTKEIWYYEHPLPPGRKRYSKTHPLKFEELMPCLQWLADRHVSPLAWRVSAQEIADFGYNLDLKNPNGEQDVEDLPPQQLADDILAKEAQIAQILSEIKRALADF
jgi:type I restriction enzyme M protein